MDYWALKRIEKEREFDENGVHVESSFFRQYIEEQKVYTILH